MTDYRWVTAIHIHLLDCTFIKGIVSGVWVNCLAITVKLCVGLNSGDGAKHHAQDKFMLSKSFGLKLCLSEKNLVFYMENERKGFFSDILIIAWQTWNPGFSDEKYSFSQKNLVFLDHWPLVDISWKPGFSWKNKQVFQVR